METPTPQLKIPTELLTAFQKDVRFVPNHLPVAGYILGSSLAGNSSNSRAISRPGCPKGCLFSRGAPSQKVAYLPEGPTDTAALFSLYYLR